MDLFNQKFGEFFRKRIAEITKKQHQMILPFLDLLPAILGYFGAKNFLQIFHFQLFLTSY